jgi:hypothetical protein
LAARHAILRIERSLRNHQQDMEIQPINYAPPLPLYRRRRFRLLLIVGVAAVVLTVLATEFLPLAWHHAQVLYWQRQAMNDAAQADQVVYESDPRAAARLIKSGQCWANGNEAIRVSQPWQHFYQLLSPPGRVPKATLFMHELRNGRGEPRLVVVEGDEVGVSSEARMESFNKDLAIRMRATVVRPASPFSVPQELPESSRAFILGQFKDLRVYAGQLDAGDNSRFSIRLTADGQTRLIDGWLRDDDTVVLETRP